MHELSKKMKDAGYLTTEGINNVIVSYMTQQEDKLKRDFYFLLENDFGSYSIERRKEIIDGFIERIFCLSKPTLKEKFEKKFKEHYIGILSEETISKSIEWHWNFIEEFLKENSGELRYK